MKNKVYCDIAKSISKLSKDKETKVGAVIVDKEGKVVSVGYNGAASGLNDHLVPYSRNEDTITIDVIEFYGELSHDDFDTWFGYRNVSDKVVDGERRYFVSYIENKYPFMLHAEQNAILTASDNKRLKGATIYVTHFPCNVCTNMIAQVGIKKVVWVGEKSNSFTTFIKNSMFIMQEAGIEIEIGE